MRTVSSSNVIGITCSDLHLSLTGPKARAESDWLGVQSRVIAELSDLQRKLRGVPIFFAGDLFDRWNPPIELINWVMEHLPFMYTIPGQHDLPLHNFEDIRKSAYYTLVMAKKIQHLPTGISQHIGEFLVRGFPWGAPISPIPREHRKSWMVHLAVCHEYIWTSGASYENAPKDHHTTAFRERLQSYDIAAFGDNHQHFLSSVDKCRIINNGTMIRRKRDEIGYRPAVGLILETGEVSSFPLPVFQDQFVLPEKVTENLDVSRFLSQLEALTDHTPDFVEAVHEFLQTHNVREDVRKTLLSIID